MGKYPYGRRGKPLRFYDEVVTEEELRESGEIGDNELEIKEELAFLYEAPAKDDPGRGHFSKWKKVGENSFKCVKGISGDDGMCKRKFDQSV